MNRRMFLKTATTVGAVASMPVLFSLQGCTSESIEALVNTVLSSAEAVLAVIEPNAPWLTDFQNAIAALQKAEQNWTAGGTITLIEDALNTLEAVTAVIPFTAPYSALIDVLVAGIEAVFAAIQSTPAPTPATEAKFPGPATSGAWPTVAHVRIVRANEKYDHSDRVKLTHPGFFEKPSTAYKKQWNAIVMTNSNLADAKLR